MTRPHRLWRFWCALVGHKPYENTLFSGRNRICQRCSHVPRKVAA